MKKFIKHGLPKKLRDEWNRLFDHSNHNKISRGAENISKSRHSAHGEEWRGQNNKQRKSK